MHRFAMLSFEMMMAVWAVILFVAAILMLTTGFSNPGRPQEQKEEEILVVHDVPRSPVRLNATLADLVPGAPSSPGSDSSGWEMSSPNGNNSRKVKPRKPHPRRLT